VVPLALRCHSVVTEGTEALDSVLESVPDALAEAPIRYIRRASSQWVQQLCTLRSLIGVSTWRAQPRLMLRPCWTGASAGLGVQALLGERHRVLPQVSVRRNSGLQSHLGALPLHTAMGFNLSLMYTVAGDRHRVLPQVSVQRNSGLHNLVGHQCHGVDGAAVVCVAIVTQYESLLALSRRR